MDVILNTGKRSNVLNGGGVGVGSGGGAWDLYNYSTKTTKSTFQDKGADGRGRRSSAQVCNNV